MNRPEHEQVSPFPSDNMRSLEEWIEYAYHLESQNKELREQLEKERIENTVLQQKLVLANKSTRYPNGI